MMRLVHILHIALVLCWALGCSCQRRKTRLMLTRDDLLISLHTSHERGVRTVITSDKALTADNTPPGLLADVHKYRESWRVFHNIKNSELTVGPRPGDLRTYSIIMIPHRAALAPFIANMTVGMHQYKWILYGDDDTVFNIDNVLRLVNGLNASNPYLLTDCLWFPQGITGDIKMHPNREAPRCLPCDFVDPLLEQPNGRDACAAPNAGNPAQYAAPRVCPCTPKALCAADSGQVFNKSTCNNPTPAFLYEGQNPQYPHMGWWYMLHGGAGALMSVGLMQQATFHDMHDFFVNHPPQSGDALISRGIWHKMGIAPTDPGYGYCRPHIQMFDPGWRGYRTRGPEDAGTADAGADSTGLIARMELYLADMCGEVCKDQILHTISVHVRGKYAAADFLGGSIEQQDAIDGQPHFRSAVFLIRKMGQLFGRVARKHAWLRRAGASGQA